MATIPSQASEPFALPDGPAGAETPTPRGERTKRQQVPIWLRLVDALASLRLTVVLFALSIGLVMIGTLAQHEKDMWDVIQDYFRSYIAWVEFRVLLPPSFFPSVVSANIPGGIFFPGGATIGALLALNLAAAHLRRFRVQARGTRLLVGSLVMLAGIVVTWLVIDSGHNKDGMQGLPAIEWGTLWTLIKLSLIGAFAAATSSYFKMERGRTIERAVLGATAVTMLALIIYLLVFSDTAALSNSSLRILWQLIQAELAAVIVLVGANLLFKQRGGIVVIHLGVGLLMFSELWVAQTAVEEQIQIKEGQTTNFARDIRDVELVIADPADPTKVDFVAIPASMLEAGNVIRDDKLPFAITPIEYFRNAGFPSEAKTGDKKIATAGHAKDLKVMPMRAASGTDSATNMAAAYVRVAPAENPEGGDVYLLSQFFGDGEILQGLRKDEPEKITAANGKTYEVSLRFRRNYKPYQIKLDNVVKEDYANSNTPRDYSSHIALTHDGETIESRIWMNNPLRFAGETFYQSGYSLDRFGEFTTLQVVTNMGWMVPYVACMIVATGMVGHFGGTLSRFLNRYYQHRIWTGDAGRDDGAATNKKQGKQRQTSGQAEGLWAGSRGSAIVAGVLVVVAAAWLASGAGSSAKTNEFDLEKFGQIPAIDGGRVKPISTLATNSLATISNRSSVRFKATEDAPTETVSAVQWFLEMAVRGKRVDDYPVFRIENPDVRDIFGLEQRKGLKYSFNELSSTDPEFKKFEAEANEAESLRRNDPTALSVKQRKLLELAARLQEYRRIQYSFQPIPFPPFPSEEQRKKDPKGTEATLKQLAMMLQETPRLNASLMRMNPPMFSLVEPGQSADKGTAANDMQEEVDTDTLPYSVAVNIAYPQRWMGKNPDPRLVAFTAMLDAFDRGKPEEFNQYLAEYTELLSTSTPAIISDAASKVSMEHMLNRLQPFGKARWLYFIGFVITCFSWLYAPRLLNRSAFWLMAFVFVVHTAALVARMYASGRPPVTNLYSSALFIAWGCAAFGLVLEAVYRLSLGNLIAGVCGFLSLSVAYYLELLGGDMMPVLQAVLDTQFWLATHVVCVSIGYLATFVAGFLGITYIGLGYIQAESQEKLGKELTRMIYGTLCFATFFSLVGTVLGGLWADDSWGRFWGWDPKENGALIIVLWNALILHARWGAMAQERGLAALAVAGNICTSWSWFGVNELGIGLHSYGFTSGVKMALGIFWMINFIIIGMAYATPLLVAGKQRTPAATDR